MTGRPGPAGSGPQADGARAVGGLSRRGLFAAGGGVGAAAAAGLGAMGLGASRLRSGGRTSSAPGPGGAAPAEPAFIGDAAEDFHGARQAGIDTPVQGFAAFLGIDLAEGTSKDDLRRMLVVLSQDAAELTAGSAPLGDQEPEMAQNPSRLTATFGFGPGLLRIAAPEAAPGWLAPLPEFSIDRLEPHWSDGDLLLQLCCEDPLSLAHAQRVLLKDVRGFGTLRWVQNGFRTAPGAEPAGTTPRNLFGQVDGTVDTAAGTPEHERIVWGQGPDAFDPWIRDGTSLVLRRIRMNLDTWDEVDRAGREDAVGRTLDTGAPLTGQEEHDEPDFEARTPVGFPVIADYAHMRRARHPDERVRIHRRVFNYDLPVNGGAGSSAHGEIAGGLSDSGLLFASYQADPHEQFVPIQRRLDELDMLNTWTAPIGSAVFAIPPGCPPGGFVGEQLW
ncbi:Dyp-type peroxidase [Kocuria palustris]|uniref:Dyp-type peroxidase n=1 Tax=Kocuria palustris TaxID=71999 RepID=UPI0021B4C3AD|nr:Dyp-type peroxidase [Kocuria palustris]